MTSDPFDDLLDLEDNFYKEGYAAGLADGEYAGQVEGKVFGMEKGYEKALELAKLHGRALVWQKRFQQGLASSKIPQTRASSGQDRVALIESLGDSKLPKNGRLVKHIDGLLSVTDPRVLALDNSDKSVTDFDDRIARAQAKAKVIAAIIGEPLNVEVSTSANTGIEDSRGLNARR